MLSSCCQDNGGSHRLFRQVMWLAALTSLWKAVWCSELSCGWVLWSFSLELLVASKLLPDTCGCISLLRPHNASSLQRSPGYGHLKSHGTATEQPPEVSSVLFVHVLLFFLQVKSQCSYILAMHWCTVRQEDENMKLKRDSWDFSVSREVWRTGSKLLFESEQDATIWTVRKSTSLSGEWRSPVSSVLFHSLLLPLRNLELTACWKATDLSGFQIIWLWINPGT